jgi:hypothetical protein
MSVNDDYLPARRASQLPVRYNPRARADDNIIDGDFEEDRDILDEGWNVNHIFDNLWPDTPSYRQTKSNMDPPSESVTRTSPNKTRRPPSSRQDYIDRAAQLVHEELEQIPQDHEVIVALIRSRIGWYLFFNRSYQKIIPIVLIISILFVTGKITQALVLFFKLFL